jgi:regulatory protein spx
MQRVVDFYMTPDDPECSEIKSFLEQQDLKLRIRDLTVKPLGVEEINTLIRHFDLKHFLNTSSKSYAKKKLDSGDTDRNEMIQLMADDNDLIKRPIVVSGRLMVVGPNLQKIMEMLQIKSNGSDPIERRPLVENGRVSKK